MTNIKDHNTAGVGSISKCFAILNCFDEEHKRLSLSQIIALTGLSKPTASRITIALYNEGLLYRNEKYEYQVGWKLYRLGKLFNLQHFIRNAARTFMDDLRDVTGETVSLYIRHGTYRVCVEQSISKYGVKRISNPGTRYPLWGGASAKLFMGYLEPELVKEVYDEAPQGRKDVWESYMEDVRAAKKDGYAMSVAEREEGVSSIACPICGRESKLIAVMCVSGPSFRFTPELQEKMLPHLIGTCRKLSEGYGTNL